MRRLVLGAAVVMLSATAHGGVFPFPHQTHTLDNGLTVVTIPMPSQGLVSYYSIVRTGSRDEVEPGHSGFAHFFEHMMFRGTERYPGPVYDRIMTELGADANAYTTDDYTAFHLTFASEDLARIVELEADRFENLSYAEREFQTEAGAVYGEYRKSRTSPFSVLFEAVQKTAFDVHTYRHTTMGFEADIAAMTSMYDYSRSFFARYYRPENVVIVIAGDFDPRAALELIRDRYGSWARGYQPPEVPEEPEQRKERSVVVEYDGRAVPMLAMMWKGPRFDPADRETVAGMLLADLAFGRSSELYRDLVLDRRIVQRLAADFGANRDPGLWGVLAMVPRPADVPVVQDAIRRTARAYQDDGPAKDRLEAVKSNLRYSFLMDMDTPDAVAGGIARFVAITGGLDAVDTFYDTVAKVTAADVRDAARRFLVPERLTVAVLEGVHR